MEELTENEIIQGAQYIALFMGWTPDEVRTYITVKYPQNGDLGKLSYHKSWDLLMPVVEKIEKLNEAFDTRIHYHADEGAYFCDIVDHDNNEIACQSSYTLSKIEVVYKAVVEFIKWYNQQKA